MNPIRARVIERGTGRDGGARVRIFCPWCSKRHWYRADVTEGTCPQTGKEIRLPSRSDP